MTVPAGLGAPFPQITYVQAGQLFDLVGLQPGDWVLSVNDQPANDPDTLSKASQLLGQSDSFRVEILRGGQRVIITVRITA